MRKRKRSVDRSQWSDLGRLRRTPSQNFAQPSRRQWFAHTAAAATSLLSASQAMAVRVGDAETSRRTRELAVASIPMRQLVPDAQRRVEQVVERPTLFRRMPSERIMCHPNLFVFLVRYPEVVVNMWALMGATKLSVKRIGKYLLDSNDGAGTKTRVELIYGNRQQHLMYADGVYAGPLFRRELVGQSVLLLNSKHMRNQRGEDIVTCTMDVFVEIQNVGVDLVAKTLHPLMGKTADHNFAESARFVSQVSEQAKHNPIGMQRLAARLTKVHADVRQEFVDLVQEIATEGTTTKDGSEASVTAAQNSPRR